MFFRLWEASSGSLLNCLTALEWSLETDSIDTINKFPVFISIMCRPTA